MLIADDNDLAVGRAGQFERCLNAAPAQVTVGQARRYDRLEIANACSFGLLAPAFECLALNPETIFFNQLGLLQLGLDCFSYAFGQLNMGDKNIFNLNNVGLIMGGGCGNGSDRILVSNFRNAKNAIIPFNNFFHNF